MGFSILGLLLFDAGACFFDIRVRPWYNEPM
jgi:hypothetical protein